MTRPGTILPSAMMAPISRPRAEPEATSARRRSPAEMWARRRASTRRAHCVPLPLPALPRTKKTLRGGAAERVMVGRAVGAGRGARRRREREGGVAKAGMVGDGRKRMLWSSRASERQTSEAGRGLSYSTVTVPDLSDMCGQKC